MDWLKNETCLEPTTCRETLPNLHKRFVLTAVNPKLMQFRAPNHSLQTFKRRSRMVQSRLSEPEHTATGNSEKSGMDIGIGLSKSQISNISRKRFYEAGASLKIKILTATMQSVFSSFMTFTAVLSS
jgi:hypothetical protein